MMSSPRSHGLAAMNDELGNCDTRHHPDAALHHDAVLHLGAALHCDEVDRERSYREGRMMH